MHWWAADFYQRDPAYFASWVFWVIFSIVMHELSHGWAALRAGDDTPRVTGHMTWNPLVHMGPQSLLMFAIVGIAWGAMPVSPHRFRGRHDEAKVAGAGPAMNLGLGLVASVLAALWIRLGGSAVSQDVHDNILTFFFTGATVNLALMILNLLPVPPLDGSKILASYFHGYRRIIYGDQGPMIALAGMVILFWSLGGEIYNWATRLTVEFIVMIVRSI